MKSDVSNASGASNSDNNNYKKEEISSVDDEISDSNDSSVSNETSDNSLQQNIFTEKNGTQWNHLEHNLCKKSACNVLRHKGGPTTKVKTELR